MGGKSHVRAPCSTRRRCLRVMRVPPDRLTDRGAAARKRQDGTGSSRTTMVGSGPPGGGAHVLTLVTQEHLATGCLGEAPTPLAQVKRDGLIHPSANMRPES